MVLKRVLYSEYVELKSINENLRVSLTKVFYMVQLSMASGKSPVSRDYQQKKIIQVLK